jgi:hypothetical protein
VNVTSCDQTYLCHSLTCANNRVIKSVEQSNIQSTVRQCVPLTSYFRQSPTQVDHASTSSMHIYTPSKVLSSISLGNMLSYSFIGAERVITLISSRNSVGKLALGHNKLGNEGCAVLRKFLCSTIGKRYAISEIDLNTNAIGNEGLSAISEFLKGDQHLKVLLMRNVS